MLKHGILGLLNYGDMTGYEIMEVFRDSLNYFWDAKTSQIYRELQGLEEKEWAHKTIVYQTGKPDKNVYSITPSGKEELLRWLADNDPCLQIKTPVLMKVFFLGEQSTEENIQYFKSVIESRRNILKGMEAAPEYIKKYADMTGQGDKALYWQMTLEYGRKSMQMQIEWAEECIRKLKGEDV